MFSASALAQDTIASGAWTKKKSTIGGTWSIVNDNGQRKLRFDEHFKAKKGPDIKVFLSPTPVDDLTGKNATKGSLFLGELESFKGAQELSIPADADLSGYASIIIHCDEYSMLWGVSALAVHAQ